MFLNILLLILVCSIANSSSLPPVQYGNVIRDLYGSSMADMILMANQWTISGLVSNSARISQYNGSPVLGGPGILGLSGSLSRSYALLPTHSIIYFNIGVKMIGSWKNSLDSFSFRVDGQLLNTFSVQQVGVLDGSGGNGKDLDTRLVGNLLHTSPSLAISFTFELKSPNAEGAFAINDLSLSFINSPSLSGSSTALLTLVDSIVQGGTTGCPSGFYIGTSSSCLPCHEACQDCFGPSSSQCFQCTPSYSLIEDECSPCNSDKFLYQNGSCLSTCPSPYIPKTSGDPSNLCNPPCAAGYAYHEIASICVDDCDLPFQQVRYGTLYCTGGHEAVCYVQNHENHTATTNCTEPTGTCPSGHFLFEDNTCNQTCPDKFTPRPNTTCSSPCGLQNALYPNGSCLSFCSTNFTLRMEGNFKFCDEINSSPCPQNQYLYKNGSCLPSCIYDASTTQSGDLYCRFRCENFLYQNDTCLPTCLAPYIKGNTTDGNGKACTFPCPLGQYLRDNGVCSEQCPSFFTSTIESVGRFCSYPCGPGVNLYQNGSCLPTCTENGFVFKFSSEIDGFVCANPCDSGQYLYQNHSCSSTCGGSFISHISGDDKLCSFPCESGYALYPNGTCTLNCEGEFVTAFDGRNYYCVREVGECPSPLDYIYQDGSCSSSCLSPNISSLKIGRKCFLPCPTGQYLLESGVCSETCPQYYKISQNNLCSNPCTFSHYFYRNGSCSETCARDQGFIFSYQNPDFLCTNPCDIGLYLYANGTCSTICQSGFTSTTYGDEMFCNFPCKTDEYLFPNGSCSLNCGGEGFTTDFQKSYRFCVGINGCPSPLDYKYQDGACNSSCLAPNVIGETIFGGRECFFPCPTGQYVLDDGKCSTTCPDHYNIRQDGLCSNPCTNDYFFRNGSCISVCPKGFIFKYQKPNFFCINPCGPGKYLYQTGSCLDTCRPDFIAHIYGDDILCDFPCKYDSPDSYLYPDGTCGQPCQGDFVSEDRTSYKICHISSNAVNKCPIGFLYQDGSCQEVCPSPYVSVLFASATKLCNLPCPLGNYYYSPNGTCVAGCQAEFKSVNNDILYCGGGVYNYTDNPSGNGSYTATLHIYVRYDISLGDFENQNGLVKFLKLLAELFGVDISQIIISNIREGSTIIESKVAVTSDSKSKTSTNSKVKTMNQKFESAAQAKNLDLGGIKVLNHRSSVVIPEDDQVQVEESSSGMVIISAAVGAGIAFTAVGVIVYSVYRRRQKLKMRRIAKTEDCQVEVDNNPAGNQQPKNNDQFKDEEFYGLAQVSIIQIKETTEINLDQTRNRIEPEESPRNYFESNKSDPLEKIEEASGYKEDSLKANNKGANQPEEKDDQVVVSLNDAVNNVEDEVTENQIELNFED